MLKQFAIGLLAVGALGAQARSARLRGDIRPYNWSTGQAENTSGGIRVVARHRVSVQANGGFRIHFEKVPLGANVFLRVTTADRQVINLTDSAIAAFDYATPYLNGNSAYLELMLRPGASTSGLKIIKTEALRTVRTVTESICGPTDDRVGSDLKPYARMVATVTEPGGCSGTLISPSCMVSAGHCKDVLKVAEFNVPQNTTPGTTVSHPPATDQYPVLKLYDSEDNGEGADWAVYRLQPNPITTKPAGTVQKEFLKLRTVSLRVGETLRITGYGIDDEPKMHVAQQTHTGELVSVAGSHIRYTTDTMPGNSGSSIIHEASGELVGIHTHGGCTASGGSNQGTLLMAKPRFRAAIEKCLADDKAEQRRNPGRRI